MSIFQLLNNILSKDAYPALLGWRKSNFENLLYSHISKSLVLFYLLFIPLAFTLSDLFIMPLYRFYRMRAVGTHPPMIWCPTLGSLCRFLTFKMGWGYRVVKVNRRYRHQPRPTDLFSPRMGVYYLFRNKRARVIRWRNFLRNVLKNCVGVSVWPKIFHHLRLTFLL